MTKTSLDVTTEALRMIGVTAVDEAASADEYDRAKEHLDAIFEELDETYGLALEWTVETVPDRLWRPLAMMVAGDVCTGYGLPQYATLRNVGMAGIMRDEFTGEPTRSTEATYF